MGGSLQKCQFKDFSGILEHQIAIFFTKLGIKIHSVPEMYRPCVCIYLRCFHFCYFWFAFFLGTSLHPPPLGERERGSELDRDIELACLQWPAVNWWKEIREQHKGYGDPTPDILRLLKLRSMTAAELGNRAHA